MDIDRLPAGNEGVDRAVVEQHDIDVAWIEPGRLDQRGRHVAKQRFGFRVAQHLLRHDRLHRQGQGHDGRTQRSQGPAQAGGKEGGHHDAGYCGAE